MNAEVQTLDLRPQYRQYTPFENGHYFYLTGF